MMKQTVGLKLKSETSEKIVADSPPAQGTGELVHITRPDEGEAQVDALPESPSQDLELICLLGAGGMGVVYKTHHKTLNKMLAIKMLHPRFATDKQLVKRFEQEAKAASLLTHEHLATVYDYGVSAAGVPYLIMDYVDGQTLQDVLKSDTVLEPTRFLSIFKQVCDALSHAHEKQLVHRDLKPANIMLVNSGEQGDFVKIVDFGIAKLLPQAASDDERLTQTGEVLGSPVYMCPEQCVGHPPDARGDIYSLGCVMYEALTGKTPFLGDNVVQTILNHLNKQPLSFAEAAPERVISSDLEKVVFKCLEKSPDKRYQNIDELKEALELVDHETSAASKTFIAQRQRKLKLKQFLLKRGKAVFLSMSALLAVAGTMAVLAIQDMREREFEQTIEAAKLADFHGSPKVMTMEPSQSHNSDSKSPPLWRKTIALGKELQKPDKLVASLYVTLAHSIDYTTSGQENKGIADAYTEALRLYDRSHSQVDSLSTLCKLVDCYSFYLAGQLPRDRSPSGEELSAVSRGQSALSHENTDAAEQAFAEALNLDRDNGDARLGMAKILKIRAAHAPDGKKLKLLYQARYLSTDQQFQDALDAATLKSGKNLESYQDHLDLGDAALKAGNLDGAIIEYERCLQLHLSQALHAKVIQLCGQKILENRNQGKDYLNDCTDYLIPLTERLLIDERAFSHENTTPYNFEESDPANLQIRKGERRQDLSVFDRGRYEMVLALSYLRKNRWSESEFVLKHIIKNDPSVAVDCNVSTTEINGKSYACYYTNPLPPLALVLGKRSKLGEAADCYRFLWFKALSEKFVLSAFPQYKAIFDLDLSIARDYIKVLHDLKRNDEIATVEKSIVDEQNRQIKLSEEHPDTFVPVQKDPDESLEDKD